MPANRAAMQTNQGNQPSSKRRKIGHSDFVPVQPEKTDLRLVHAEVHDSRFIDETTCQPNDARASIHGRSESMQTGVVDFDVVCFGMVSDRTSEQVLHQEAV